MKRVVTRIIAFGLAFFLFPFLTARAEEDSSSKAFEISIDGYLADGNELLLYINHNRGADSSIDVEDTTVAFGNQKMPITEITKLADMGEPVSYLCLADISGSLDKKRIEQTRNMIKKLASIKNPDDSICIVTMGNDLKASEYMTNIEDIDNAAEKIELTHEDTNLYYGLVEQLKSLQASDVAHQKKCLIIFSDGADDQATGITREEADKAVKEYHIPIFTVGLLKDKPKDSEKETAKLLGSFARESAGGEHYVPALASYSVEDVPSMIKSVMDNSVVMRGDLSVIKVYGQKVNIKVTVSNQEGDNASSDITIPESDVKIIIAEQEKAQALENSQKETKKEEPVKQTAPEKEPEKDNTVIYFAVGGGVFLFILILVIVLIMKRKGNDDWDEIQGEEPVDSDYQYADAERTIGDVEPMTTMGDSNSLPDFVSLPLGAKAMPSGPTVATMPLAGEKGSLSVRMARMGKADNTVYTANVKGTCTIGRSNGKSQLAFPSDNALSGLHCTLISKNGKLFVKDNDSTNGTYVNGIPVHGELEINQDDVLLIGSYEYRLSWKE